MYGQGDDFDYRNEEIEKGPTKQLRFLDTLVDELAKGKQWRRSCGCNKEGFKSIC
ncbi:MAG: DUF2200 family protein [Candidatus Kapaibacteriota bacterium]